MKHMMNRRVIASIEARMGSFRLPGKVLADMCGKPCLSRLLARLRRCTTLDGIILATSIANKDDALEQWANTEGVMCHRGSEDDVLRRVVEANQKMNSDIVVEICGDMILLDHELIDLGVEMFFANDCDVLTTTRKASYPVGIDVVVFRLEDLEWIERNISDPLVREHVSQYFFQYPDKYRILDLLAPKRLKAPNYRFVLDYPEDLEFIRTIYARLAPKYGDDFGTNEIINVLQEEPSLLKINSRVNERK